MKNTLKKAAALACAMGILCAGAVNGISAQAADGDRTIYVVGKGGVKAAPDIANITITVSTKKDEAIDAQSGNNAKIAAIIAAMEDLGVAKEDVTTSGYSLTQNRVYRISEWYPDGYTASSTMLVTMRDIDLAGASVDRAVAAGATRISGIQFTLADSAPYYAQALEAAGKDARGKADALARSLGTKVTAVITVQEVTTSSTPISYSYDYEPLTATASAESDSLSMPVQAGDISITAEIKVTFAIE